MLGKPKPTGPGATLWIRWLVAFTCGVMLSWPRVARGSEDRPPVGLWQHADRLKLEVGGLFALLSYAGFRDWKWGTAYFQFRAEGFFGMRTGSGGQDKLGHCFSTYLMSETLYLRLRNRYGQEAPVTVYPALFSWLLMAYVEMFDGFSVDHGFSKEDLLMDTLGASTSFLKRSVPSVGRVFDFRMEYYPSTQSGGFHPMIDYSGQKFLLALRPSGLPLFDDSPFRFFELYLGYYTRGFERISVDPERRAVLFTGVGVDLQAIFASQMGDPEEYPGSFIDTMSVALRTFQLPYGYPTMTLQRRTAPLIAPRPKSIAAQPGL